jgi:hypothetical protein
VRANLVYREFTRVGSAKAPDAKTMGRWGLALGPEVIKQVHQRLVKIAQGNGVTPGRKMRVDTTVVETNIHYPPTAACWACPHAADEAGHGDHREGGGHPARSDVQCEAAAPRNWPGSLVERLGQVRDDAVVSGEVR